jgi:hypothetical protein
VFTHFVSILVSKDIAMPMSHHFIKHSSKAEYLYGHIARSHAHHRKTLQLSLLLYMVFELLPSSFVSLLISDEAIATPVSHHFFIQVVVYAFWLHCSLESLFLCCTLLFWLFLLSFGAKSTIGNASLACTHTPLCAWNPTTSSS